MKIVIRTNDVTLISFASAVLRDSGIEPLVFDENVSVLEGSIGIFPRRIMVVDEDYDAARRALANAELGAELESE